jgi:predicted ester cyclase
MPSEENKALVRQAIDAFNQRNIEGFLALFAPGCIFHEPPASAPRTLADVRQSAMNALTSATFPDLQMRLEDLIAEGEKIVVRYS